LFASCVAIDQRPGALELTNKSDIPCVLQINGGARELPAHRQLTLSLISGIKKLTVTNWLAGMNRPLEVDLG
jgi:hypothetical protein